MIRLANIFWLLVVAVAAFMLYQVKYEVQAIQTQIANAEKELRIERQSLHVVAAEWAYLNRPERLQALAVKYLSAAPATAQQIAGLETIPYPRVNMAQLDLATNSIQPAKLLVREPNP